MYTPIAKMFGKDRFPQPKQGGATTPFSQITLDLKDSPQLMNPKQALRITNYVQTTDGGLQKRQGLQRIFNVAGNFPITMLFAYTNDILIFGFNTTVAAYDFTTDAVTNIKTNFAPGSFSGVRYGEYAFVCNKTESIGRISRQVTFSGLSGTIGIGSTITGATSGATAVVIQNSAGVLTLGSIVGTFQNGETIDTTSLGAGAFAVSVLTLDAVTGATIVNGGALYNVPPLVTFTGGGGTGATGTAVLTDGSVSSITISAGGSGYSNLPTIVFANATGTATLTSAVTWNYTTVYHSPIAGVLAAISGRLFAGDLQEDETAVRYSDQDVGTNPPFEGWTTGTLATDPGKVYYRNAGRVTTIFGLGPNIVVGATQGKWAFNIASIDVGGSLKKDDQFVIQRQDMGMARGALVTPGGAFYVNKGGLWKLESLGQSNVPYSAQEQEPSILLGANYFDDSDLSNTDITYNAKYDTVFVTLAKGSVENNYVIAYNNTTNVFSEFTGWNINRFYNANQIIYGASSLQTRVWEILTGNDDDGNDIWTEFYQELQTGGLETRQFMKGQYIDAFMIPGSVLKVAFDIYDVKGNFIPDYLTFDVIPTTSPGRSDGWGNAEWGRSSWGGDEDNSGMVEWFGGSRGYIRNYQRVRVRITGHDKNPHILVWFKMLSEIKIAIRRRTNIQTSS